MAQSRPPPVRAPPLATSPPPLSPRGTEKKHHTRRKSGKEYVASEKKSHTHTRPAMPRRSTGQTQTPAMKSARREREEEVGSGESFLQYWYVVSAPSYRVGPRPLRFSLASDVRKRVLLTCRIHDQAPTARPTSFYLSSPPLTPYPRTYSSQAYDEGPDIIPRFSPTQSRPRSYFNSDPYPRSSSQYHSDFSSQFQYQYPDREGEQGPEREDHASSTALASLRSLATALPKSSRSGSRDAAPESPPHSISRNGSGVWDYIPSRFTGSKTTAPTPSATPGNSWTMTYGAHQSQSYGAGRSREDLHGYGKNPGGAYGEGGGFGSMGGMGMDRPLPPRRGPSGYGHRPKSIDLVTPFSGH
ncbi:hypothetical protein BUE80_DR013512 [Diplocarpon rosae]|nr:hypothetical protein BUE80_DR013512 [Diplocarpon rosae]